MWQQLEGAEGVGVDDDDIGPRSELAWWKMQATKLNSICDDLRSEECWNILQVLRLVKSRKLKAFKAINNLLTDTLNEAKDNVKYLSTVRSQPKLPCTLQCVENGELERVRPYPACNTH